MFSHPQSHSPHIAGADRLITKLRVIMSALVPGSREWILLFEYRSSKLMKSGMAIMPVLTVAWLLLLFFLPVTVNATEELSAGYRVTDINELADGSGIVAHLKLISGSETYGPDLEDLKLTARYVRPALSLIDR